ncbi:STAS-like domain-containing protein [Solitalea lacus]|uniref:STAS-like domain-containing protein n=1 Tax=Solitalea lacus TaxID=2911172 RepID=UPI001EDB411F|nr:DUF4325 domain-containing protein [Solitalea lacus]UKJ06243.1 STAS-like domain-containing protein [Solitalea lacus]
MIVAEIRLTDLLPNTLDTREGASKLVHVIKEELKDNNKIELDFSDVVFMSRSFADQFHKEINTGDNKFDIVFKNIDYSITEMLAIVSKTQTHRKPINKSYQVLSFNELSKMSDFIYAW